MLKVNVEQCYGCGACYNACPTQAINMQENQEGFLYPYIDETKCINCCKCEKVCPIEKVFSQQYAQKFYAVWGKDKNIVQESSSGGVFGCMAEYVLEQGGIVCGAAFNQYNQVQHIIVTKKSELNKLQGSKYVQSDIGNIYQEVAVYLNKGTKVLFSGTPCQVAGLRKYLNKVYANLWTIDVACHGVPSPKVWQKYIKELGEKITNIKFRDKSCGWRNFSFSFYKNNQKQIKLAKKDVYFKGFLNNLFLRKSCENCQYANLERPGDITLADFWGIQKYKKSLYNKQGTSLVIANNDKGQELLDNLRDKFAKCVKVPADIAIKGNSVFIHPTKPHPLREYFFANIDKRSISELIASINKNDEHHQILNSEIDDKKIGIMNFHYNHSNFGAVMVPYALCTMLKKLGYKPEIINFLPGSAFHQKTVFEIFREKYLTRSIACHTQRDLDIVSKNYHTFISGSDQVFRHHLNGKYLFNFVSGLNRIISYAGSFGKDVYLRNDIEYVKSLFNRFDALSVREKSGVEIMKTLFGQNAEHVLDPTLLLSGEDYQTLIDDEQIITHQKYIGKMFLDEDQNIAPICIDNQTYPIIDCIKTKGQFHSVAQWLNNIKNCSYFITDSFHGCVFAIIFKKQFICITRNKGGNSRLESLFSILGIGKEHLMTELPTDYKKAFANEIDYNQVEKMLKTEQEKSIKYLKEALELPLTYKERLTYFDDIESRYTILGIPFFAKKLNGLKVEYYLFNKILFLSKEKEEKYDVWNLFGKLKIIKSSKRKNVVTYKLFSFLPIIKIKYKD